jgi:glycosyltransferase involved in cell wall biosynthesis
MDARAVCVLHVAGSASTAANGMFEGTVRALSQIGLRQMLLRLRPGLAGPAHGDVELRSFAAPEGFFSRVRALHEELGALAAERTFYAVHLHGAFACLFGSRALRGSALSGRMLLSPHLADLAPWRAALVGQLLRTELAPLHAGVVLASPGEAPIVSRLLERSTEVLPPAVDGAFFQSSRSEPSRPLVVAGGRGVEAVDVVSRLAVLLNGRDERVPLAWLGAVSRAARAQLEATGVQVHDSEAIADRLRVLGAASAYVHVSASNRQPHALAQAMAVGVPCLASDTYGHRALLRHGETGYICSGVLDYIEKLVALLRDPAERERIGQAARAEASRAFTQRHFETAVLRAYGFHRVTPLPRKSVHVA